MVAYSSSETGAFELYVMSFPHGKKKQRISTNGGTFARWRDDGRELFYWGGGGRVGNVMRVDVKLDSSDFRVGVPELLFEPRFTGVMDSRSNYAVTPDGERFLLRRPSLDPPPVTVIVNWTAELEK